MPKSKMSDGAGFAKINLSLCLEDVANYQISFLNHVNQRPELYDPAFLKYTLYRYEVMWLPLAAKHDYIAAPLDIEWVWHCHMLAPLAYGEDCERVVGKLVNHVLYSDHMRQSKLIKCKDIWQKAYPSEPFDIPPNTELSCPEFKSKINYDIVAAASRQKVFIYQVSLPHYNDRRFIKQAVIRYKKYLNLKRKNPGTFLVPCYDIDLIWHTHQLHPSYYVKDTKALFKRVFNHDDTVNDRSPNSKLSLSDIETRNLWIKTYNETFSMYGAMYRGDPPEGKLYKISQGDIFRISFKNTTFVVEKVTVQNIPADVTKFHIMLRLVQHQSGVANKKMKGPELEWEGKALLKHNISTISKCHLDFDLFSKVGIICCGNMINIGSGSYDFRQLVHSSTNGQSFSETFVLNESTQATLQVKGHFTTPTFTGCKFIVTARPYQKCTLPTYVEQMWGPVPLPQLPPDVNNICHVAEHL